jgi:hypothetical protein
MKWIAEKHNLGLNIDNIMFVNYNSNSMRSALFLGLHTV